MSSLPRNHLVTFQKRNFNSHPIFTQDYSGAEEILGKQEVLAKAKDGELEEGTQSLESFARAGQQAGISFLVVL